MCDVCQGINSHKCPVCSDWGDVEYIDCPECHGTGAESYWAIDRRTGDEVEVTKNAYYLLPDNEHMAIAFRSWYYKSGTEPCGHCNGTGYKEL